MAPHASKILTSSFMLLVTVMFFSLGLAAPVTVSWDPNTESDLAGYNIYVGEVSGTYTGVVDVGNTTQFAWNNLDEGKTYYFAVTAYDLSGNESDFSDEVSATPSGTDLNPPELIDVLVQGETQLNVSFSEALDKSSAEDISNYTISNNVSVVGAVLDADQATVHLLTSNHEQGVTYVLTVQDITDVAGNKVAAGSSKSYTLPNPNGDSTPPEINNVLVVDQSHLDVIFSEAVTRASAEEKGNFEINNGVDVLQASQTNNKSIVRLTTTPHSNGTTYRLTINNIRDIADNKIIANSSFSYDVNIDENDNTPPLLLTVVVNGATQIDVNFSEPLEKQSAERKENYSISSGVEVLGAILDDNTTTVHLITGPHADDQEYTLSVSNIRDRAEDPNAIAANSAISYAFEKDGRIDPNLPTDGVTPQTFALFQNYPNPFNPETEIRFFLEKQRQVELKVYNPLGQTVKTLINDEMPGGFHTVVWDGTNEDKLPVPSGIYIYSLEVKRQEQKGDLLVNVSLDRRVMRMTLLK